MKRKRKKKGGGSKRHQKLDLIWTEVNFQHQQKIWRRTVPSLVLPHPRNAQPIRMTQSA